MKLFPILLIGLGVLSTLLVLVHSTFITTAAGAGFIGGFVMGKMTLGMFLAAMNTLNQRQVPAAPTKVVTRDQSGFLNIPDDLEGEVRDRFLRQLGKMDPLNCLPKVFCEVSSDPKSASEVFGPEAVKLLSQSSLFNPTNADKKRKKPVSGQDDLGDDEDNSSQSDEDDNENDDEPMNEEDKKMEEYERKEKAALKSKGLDEMLEAYDDPLNYYFILKEKKKQVSPELMSMIKDMDLDLSHRRSFVKSQPSMLRRRIGVSSKGKDARANVKGTKIQPESSIDDAFADDPFFEEFSSSVRRPLEGRGAGGVVNVGLLRRNRRDAFTDDSKSDDITMGKYKIAAEVAELKDPSKCRKVFDTCPFTSEEVMNMITQLNSEDQNKTESASIDSSNTTDKKDNSLNNLKNTLFAIEKLNDATLTAEALGKPVDYTKVVQEATQSNTQVSDGSTKILEELDQIEEKFTGPDSTEIISKRKLKKSNKNQKKKQKHSIRIRRHNNDGSRIRILSIETLDVGSRDRKNRKQPQQRQRITVLRQNGKLVLTGDRDDEFLAHSEETEPVGDIRKYKFSEDSDSEEDDVSEEVKLPNIYMGKIKTQTKSKPVHTSSNPPTPKKKVEVLHSEQEDDEFNSPESEEAVVNVPSMTFSQTFIDALGGPSSNLRKPKPKPIHKVVQVKPQILRVTTSPPTSTSSTTRKPVKAKTSPLPKLHQKFSGESEDDEEDANNTEKQIDVLVSKYKPKDKLKE